MTPGELDDLVTGAEIGRRMGVTRARVAQLAAEPGFPPALGRVGASKVWRWADIQGWLATSGRPQRVEETKR